MKSFSTLLVLCMVAAMLGTVSGATLVTNGSFEDGAPGGIPTGWTHQPGNARSEIYLIDNIATDGRQALFIKNASPWKPNTYSSVSQQLPLKPNVRYRLSCSIKGEGVRRLVFVLGDRWQIRFSPKVTEGWKKHEFEFTLLPQDIRGGTAMLRILTEDVTEGAWIDQVDIQPVGGAALAASEFQPEKLLTAKRLTTPLDSLKGIPAGLATVTLPADRNFYTGKTLPSPDQFRAELALAYDDKGVIFLAEVKKKDVRGGSGANMWSFDSIQIGVSPECSFSEKREPGDLEIGFSPLPGGVADYCWTLNRPLSSKEVELRGGPTATGYFIAARLNWELFRNSGFRDADAFSFNAIVNINTDGIREVALLQPGIHDGKSKKRNTLVLFERERPTGFFRVFSRRSPTELTGTVYLTGLEMPDNWELPVELTDCRGEKTTVQLSNMPAVKQDMIVVRDVRLPLTRMAEGMFGISFPVEGSRISGGAAEKVDLFARQQAALKILRERFSRANATVKESGLEHPYLAMYNAVIGRLLAKQEFYLNREQSPEAREYYLTLGERVDRDLSLAQDEFDALIAKLRSGEKVPFSKEVNPVFFAGYGHFDDVIRDIPFMQKVGANLIQFETGPSRFLKEGKNGEFIADPAEFRNRIEPALKAAKENHVKIALLLSPHYHPRWWLEAHPELKRGNGLTHYEVNAPEARRMLNAYLDCLLPLLRDSRYRDALHSIVTTNEPNYAGANWSNPMTRAFFREWCEKRYGTIEAFNAVADRKFKSFAELADTDPAGDPAVNYAFEIFRRTTFADFHRFLADRVKQYLPDMPVSSKIMIGTTYLPMGVNFAVDPELFAEISDFNGNDAGMVYKADRWISAWRAINLSHDLQYSLRPMPILNTENHIIRDGEEGLIPADHIYTAVFEQFLQGAGGLVTWVWAEGTFKRSGDAALRGGIYHRPTDIIAHARALNDANRLAEPISAYVKAKPQIALLYSPSSLIQSGEKWSTSLIDTYTQLCFTGHKIGFISEKQLAKEEFGKFKAVILTDATYLSADAAEGLARFAGKGGKIFAVGEAPKYNSFGGNLPVKLPVETVGAPGWKEWQARLDRLAPLPVSLEAEGGNEGIFFRAVPTRDGSYLVHLVNYNTDARRIRLKGKGSWSDLIRECEFNPEFELQPQKPQFLRFLPMK